MQTYRIERIESIRRWVDVEAESEDEALYQVDGMKNSYFDIEWLEEPEWSVKLLTTDNDDGST